MRLQLSGDSASSRRALEALVRTRAAPAVATAAEGHAGGLFKRLFRAAAERDGSAHGLEAEVRRIGNLAEFGDEPEIARAAQTQRRARRPIALPRQLIVEALSEKVLHDWLQNRHQTLYPLTINLRRLDAGQVELILQVAALFLSAIGTTGRVRTEQGAAWLASVGAQPEQLGRFAVIAADPPALAPLLERVQEADLGALAYAVSRALADPRNAVSRLFLDYLAARLAVPNNVLRSVNRRYRG